MIKQPDDNSTDARTRVIRALNDRFRQTFKGGRVVATAGMMALDEAKRLRIFIAVQDFDEGNDPSWRSQAQQGRHEHDFGALDAEGERVMFKIDYLDPTLTLHSEDPADPAKTVRVMTIMLADEY